MTKSIALLLVPIAALLVLSTAVTSAQVSPAPASALRAAMDKEVLGDLKGAIEEYRRIADRNKASDRAIAAQALLRMAGCYEKLGDAEAQRIYERITKEFPEQGEATNARARLAQLKPQQPSAPTQAGIYTVAYDPETGKVTGVPTRFPSSTDPNCAPSWSPDGTSIAFKRNGQSAIQWVVRSLSTGQERIFTDDGTNGFGGNCWVAPLWHHDGKSLLNGTFVERNGTIARINLDTMKVADAGIPSYKAAVVLSADDRSLYLTSHNQNQKETSIIAVELASGNQKLLWTSPAAVDPNILVPLRLALSPDGKTFALVLSEGSKSRLVRVNVDGTGYKVLHEAEGEGAAGAALSRSGLAWTRDGNHLLFIDSVNAGQQRLMRISANGGTPEFSGLLLGSFDAMFDVSVDGRSIAFFNNGIPRISTAENVKAPSAPERFQLAWFDRSGKFLEPVGEPDLYRGLELSPDGKQVAAHIIGEKGSDIWIGNAGGQGTMRRLTNDTTGTQDNGMPVWSQDGRQIAFRSYRNGRHGLYVKTSDGSGPEQLLVEAPLSDNRPLSPMTWSPDGQFLVYQSGDSSGRNDLWVLSVAGNRKPVLLGSASYQPRISPDGKWVAFSLNPAGNVREIHIRPFPDGKGDWKIADGGNQPRWRSDGKELYYIAGDQLMVVDLAINATTVKAGTPRAMFEHKFAVAPGNVPTHQFAISADGQRVLISRSADSVTGGR